MTIRRSIPFLHGRHLAAMVPATIAAVAFCSCLDELNSDIIPPGDGTDSVSVAYIVYDSLWFARRVPKHFVITLPSPMDSVGAPLPDSLGATFLGWNTVVDQIDGFRMAGDTVTVTDDTDFYAIFVQSVNSTNP